ncbi:MAG: Alpha-D-kanosaminyltransferase [Syntrophorhabdus sp. PtaB.Bin027]|nr:MAG: Alpha-D-kanosaminyltransferase [Syntrophorhabdus sp. PtaB.Bin027]
MKITYLSQAPVKGIGIGGGPRVKGFIEVFNKLKYNIDLISYSFYSDKNGIETIKMNDQFQTTIIHTSHKLPRIFKFFAIFPASYHLIRSCKTSDIILADFNCLIASFPSLIVGKLCNKKVILDCIDTKLDKCIPDIFFKILAKKSDIIFAISHHLENKLKIQFDCKKVIYIPIFINTDQFSFNKKDRSLIREQLKFNDDDILIGYVGSFTYYEGIPILIQAFKNLLKQHNNIKLVIIGKILWKSLDDKIDNIIDNELNNYLTILPPQNHEDIPKFLSAFDILCCPKIDCEINRAANPVKVAEYLAMGIPTVASGVGGINELIMDNVEGFLTKPGDISDLERKLGWVIENIDLAKKIGVKGRSKIVEKYSVLNMGDVLNKILLNLNEK